jgi:hypothetical protein
MELVIFVAALVGLAAAAQVFGTDSRPSGAERRSS